MPCTVSKRRKGKAGMTGQVDGPVGRMVAGAVLAVCVAGLVYVHRDDIWRPDAAPAVDPNDPVAVCLAARTADIDQMVADGVVDTQRADTFK